MSEPDIGLREQKKQLTRESIANAALQLALDKGLDGMTIEEIAQKAFVSPRTVSNYFSCKEEAVVAAGTRNSHGLLEEFTLRPESEPPLESLRVVLLEFVRSRPAEQLELSALKAKLAEQYPSLRPFQLAYYEQMEGEFRRIVATRSGTDVSSDMYPWLVSAAAMSAVQAAMRLWVTSESPADKLPGLIDAAFRMIAGGLRSPATGGSAGRPAQGRIFAI